MGSIIKKIIQANKNIYLSISITTRYKRTKELNGKDYYFVSKKEFSNHLHNFLEYKKIFTNYYGTPKINISKTKLSHINTTLDINIHGHKKFKNKYYTSLSIFIMPTSFG